MATSLDRREAVRVLLEERGDLLVVTGLGSPTYDVNAAGDHPGNYYLWGAMGGAALIGLGLAQAQPDRHVLVVTGDGEQLMGLGGLATIAVAKPANLTIAVIDNSHFGETGMQPSHTGKGLDLAAVARACGFTDSRRITSIAGIKELRRDMARPGLRFAAIIVKAENIAKSLPSRDAVYLKIRFREHLGLGAV